MEPIAVIMLSIALFVIIVLIAAINSDNKYIMVMLTFIICLGGFLIYGSAYSAISSDILLQALKTTSATIKMFTGGNQFSEISETPIMQFDVIVILFWTIHFMALAITAKAVLAIFSSEAMDRIRSFMDRNGDLVIIFGVNEASLVFGEELRKDTDYSIVYVDKEVEPQHLEIIKKRLMARIYTNSNAINATLDFFKQVDATKHNRNILLFTLHDNELENIEYARQFDQTLKKSKLVVKSNVSLTMIANMELNYGFSLQADADEKYGFGSVLTLDRAFLSARTLVGLYPPVDYIDFDTEKCIATSDFHAVIIGFGKIGQAVLKKLVMNGQFEGSHFKVTIYDPMYKEKMGTIYHNCKAMFETYDIEFKEYAPQSVELCKDLIDDQTINYITVCIDDPLMNSRVVSDIQSLIHHYKANIPVFQCNYEGVYFNNCIDNSFTASHIFSRNNLDIQISDRRAMVLNYIYCHTNMDDTNVKPIDYWIKASYMDKMSSRASADFSTSLLEVMGKSMDEILSAGNLEGLSNKQLQNLGRTEHHRWCAFHYAMGYSLMTDEVFNSRCNEYKRDIEKNGKSGIKIQKDDEKYMHICLVPWEELDELSEKYNNITKANKDYKQDDINNVLMIPKLLSVANSYNS